MKLVGILAAATLATFAATSANAAVTVNINQSGSNVVATTSGSLNLTGLTSVGLFYSQAGTQGSDGYIGTGAGGLASEIDAGTLTFIDGYSGLTGPASFGSGAFRYADAGSGDAFGLNSSYFGPTYVFVPTGYVSGTALSANATFDGETLASLGLTAGSYVYSSADDSVTINIASAVPEPATWAMFLVGFGAIGFAMRRPLRKVALPFA